MRYQFLIQALVLALFVVACSSPEPDSKDPKGTESAQKKSSQPPLEAVDGVIEKRGDIYTPVKLTADMSTLTKNQKDMIKLLIQAAKVMDDIFWEEAYGSKAELLSRIEDPKTRRFAEINYGPWDRLDNNKPFLKGVGEKPKGANFYPADMTEEEFNQWDDDEKNNQYSLIRRNAEGALEVVRYADAFAEKVEKAAELLTRASELAEDEGLRNYLLMRADALRTDDYNNSDIAWLEMKNNTLDIIIGPIENYEDKLFGKRTAHEAYVLIKDKAWSQRLEKYVALLPGLQQGLPVDAKYKAEKPGLSSQLNAYDIVYYAGDCNSASKTIAVNLPNDETLQIEHGTRRSQLKNAMRAKYDKILLPLADELIAADQRGYITFNAFFSNTMFHEVAHGLGIKHTINGKGTVKDALGPHASALEEGKADILGLYMITELFDQGELNEGQLMDHYVTFLAGIFRSVRFGASSAHGRANMIRFNYFKEAGAFTRDEASGTYAVNPDAMQQAVTDLSALILTLQGDGDLAGVEQLIAEKGNIGSQLQADLDRLSEKGIPVDIVFEQGITQLGL